jgi:Putative transposase
MGSSAHPLPGTSRRHRIRSDTLDFVPASKVLSSGESVSCQVPRKAPRSAASGVSSRQASTSRNCGAASGAQSLRSIHWSLKNKDWVVYAKKPFAGPTHVIRYLAHYTHRVAIANGRLLHFENGFVKIRHFGFLANREREHALPLCSILLSSSQPVTETARAEISSPPREVRLCPYCHGALVPVARLTSVQLLARNLIPAPDTS